MAYGIQPPAGLVDYYKKQGKAQEDYLKNYSTTSNVSANPNPEGPSPSAASQASATPGMTDYNMEVARDANKLDSNAAADLSIADYIKEMQDAIRQSRYAALDKSRQNALGNLDTQDAGIDPAYYNRKNTVAANSDVGAMNFAQYMAARGIKGNAGAMPEIYRNAGLQSNIGALERQQQGEHDQIARNRTGIENAYQSDMVAANADVEAQGLQAYISQLNADRAYNLQLGEATGNIGGTPTLAARQLNNQTNQWQQTFDYNKSRDEVADQHWQQQLNLDIQKQSFAEAQQTIENAYQSRQITLQEKNNALDWAKYNADQDPNSIDNKLKAAQIDANNQAKEDTTLNNAIQRLDSMYLTKDPFSGSMNRNSNYSDAQLRAAIIGLNLSDSQTDSLLLRYGLPINQ